MMPRDGRNRRRRPIDQVLNPSLPTAPLTTGGGERASIPGGEPSPAPIDTVLGGGETTGGNENPWVNPFMEVYEATEAGALRRLDKRQKEMAEKFAHKGGYFGGEHAIAQGEMEAETGAYLDKLLAETSLGASERQYQDWQRGRGEIMSLLNLIPMLLGTETTMPFIQERGPGAGGILGSLLGAGAGSILGPMGGAIGSGIGGNIMGGKGGG